MEFEGKIIFMGSEETVGANNTRKITFVLEENTDKEFKQSICLEQLWDKKVDMAKNFKEWDIVKVSLDCRARERNGRWFNGLSAWRMEWDSNSSNNSDDLPF